MLERCVLVVLLACLLSCTPAPVFRQEGAGATGEQERWLAKGYRYDENGWIFLHIEGEPFERGFQRGYLTANEIEEFLRTLAQLPQFEGKILNSASRTKKVFTTTGSFSARR